MKFRILTVCSANVCRSPFIETLLSRALADSPTHFVVASAGENAADGQHACTVVAQDHGTSDAELIAHRATTLSTRAVEAADLVLAADRPSRAAVVRLQPTSHARAFTLREAAVLAEHAVGTERPTHDDPVDALLALVAEMSDLRGTVEMPRSTRHRVPRKPWRRVEVHGNDVPDAHKAVDPVSHAVVSRMIIENASTMASVLSTVVRSASDGTGPGQARYVLG
ncbi:hypothetical protein FE697_011520 [Mumia zhuanghuii]|uniref:Phosphotyrosine protein phosphatase I domain-containing protein n=2 Tax=Mumia TaxID=1546255 RepID=A0ABW1QI47_9ACTN|nr:MULTISPECIES: hypothetical protein [Mumia]KAA1422783.1 hypothetical protein FE697_011520 [Mumia zhuanghuii]